MSWLEIKTRFNIVSGMCCGDQVYTKKILWTSGPRQVIFSLGHVNYFIDRLKRISVCDNIFTISFKCIEYWSVLNTVQPKTKISQCVIISLQSLSNVLSTEAYLIPYNPPTKFLVLDKIQIACMYVLNCVESSVSLHSGLVKQIMVHLICLPTCCGLTLKLEQPKKKIS